MHASSSQQFGKLVSVKTQESAEYIGFLALQNIHNPVIGSASSCENEIHKIYFEKNEEESIKRILLKTFTHVSNYLTAFYTQSSISLFSDTKSRLSVVEHWFYSSSHRYNILRVLRI